MKRLNPSRIRRTGKSILCLFGFVLLLGHSPALGAGPAGLSVNLFLKPDGSTGLVPLGAPIEMLLVVKNQSLSQLITERDFSKKKFYLALILVSNETNKVYTLSGQELHPMMSAFYVAGRPMVRAEVLPAGWVKSTGIADLRELFPVLKTQPGTYGLRAELPFLRFQWGLELNPLGQLGALDHPDNFNGILVSNQIKLNVFPARGAELNVRVTDLSGTPAAPLPQVEVKVFRRADLPADYSPADVFTNLDPVLAGTTDFDGNTTWQAGTRCLLNEDYVIIAAYGTDYGEAAVAKDTEPGWQDACSGFIEKEITFGQPSQVAVDDLVTVSYGRVIYNRRTGEYSYTATLVNSSTTDLQGPVWLVIQNLVPSDAVVTNADGLVEDSPYLELLGAGMAFNSGQTLSRVLIIKNPSRYRITFDDQVRAVIP
jgi:hypothetical protein